MGTADHDFLRERREAILPTNRQEQKQNPCRHIAAGFQPRGQTGTVPGIEIRNANQRNSPETIATRDRKEEAGSKEMEAIHYFSEKEMEGLATILDERKRALGLQRPG